MKIRVVLDNNILFSLLNPNSINSYLFSSIKADFIAPELIKSELEKYKEECLIKSSLSEHEFAIRYDEICTNIKFVKSLEYKDFLVWAVTSLPDPKDSPYLALALSANAILWSNDLHLKQQSLAKVFTTE